MKIIRNKLMIVLSIMLLATVVMPSKVKAVSIDFATGKRIFATSGSTTIDKTDNPNIIDGSITVNYVEEGKIEITFNECQIRSVATPNDENRRAFSLLKSGTMIGNQIKMETIKEVKIIFEGINSIYYEVTNIKEDSLNKIVGFGAYINNVPVKIEGSGSMLMDIYNASNSTAKEAIAFNNISQLEMEDASLIIHTNNLKGSGFYMDPGDTFFDTNPASLSLKSGSYIAITAYESNDFTLFDMPAHDDSLPAPTFNISNNALVKLNCFNSNLAKAYVNNSTVPTLGSSINAIGGEPYSLSTLLKYDITDPIQHKLLSNNQYVQFSDYDATAYEYITSDVTIEEVENGTVEANEDKVKEYHTAKLNITPDAGYKLKSVKILKAEDDTDITTSVKYDAKENTFEMPGYEVKAKVEFEKIDYKLSAKATDGTVTFENDITTAQIGDQFKVILTPAFESYILDKLTVTNTDTKEDVTNDMYDTKTGKITMKDYPITVTTTFKDKHTYEIISGDNSKVKKDEIKDVEVRIDGNYKEFTKVYVDDLELPKTNYDSKEGSTIITLKKSYLETLKPGIYKMKVAFENSNGIKKDVETTFEIKGETVQVKPNGNPQTGDNILMYVALLVLSTISCGVVILRKRQLNK